VSRPADDYADATSGGADVADVADVAEVADGAARKAERLLRWYPRPWRDRYEAEFTELLMADISERPRSPRRYGVWIAARVRLHPDLPAGISVGATNATIIALLVLALAVAAQAARMAVRGARRARA
jgi:hypothetical protein